LPKTKKKKSGWSFKRFRVGINVLIGKVDAEFEKNEIPKKPSRNQRSRIKKEVGTGLANLAKVEGQPQNIVASTVSEIMDKERRKAIRSGDYGTAFVASIIQYYADQAKNQPPSPSPHWQS
jgi:hypothetical protein